MNKSANAVRTFVLATAVLALAILPAGTVGAADEKVSLAPKYLPGKYVINMSINSESTATKDDKEMPGGKMNMEITMEMSVSNPADNGNKELALQFTKFKISMAVPGQPEASYSSTQPGDESKEPWASVVKCMLAAKVTATIAPDGSVSKVKGAEEAFANIAGDAASVAVKNQMKSFFSEDSIKELIDSSRKMLPKDPVAVGQNFKNTAPMKFPMFGAVDLIFEGKVLSIDKTDKGSVAIVDFQMKFDKGASTTKPATAVPAMENLKQFAITQKGKMKFDIALGIATEQKVTQTTDMEMLVGKETMKLKQTSTILAETIFTPAK